MKFEPGHLVQVGVAPDLSISKDSGCDPALSVVLPTLCGRTPLKTSHLASTAHTHTNTHGEMIEMTSELDLDDFLGLSALTWSR